MRYGKALLAALVGLVVVGCMAQSDRLTLDEAREELELCDEHLTDLAVRSRDAELAYKETGKAEYQAIVDKLDAELETEGKAYKRLRERVKALEQQEKRK